METFEHRPGISTRSFILITSFLNFAGIGIINPVYPYIVGEYSSPQNTAFTISLLFTVYSLCQFLAVPTLGALSDRYGRRPVLLISLLGSALGYLLFGIGGSLFMLFLGRIIDGVTGGNIATIYAYAADISETKNRTKFFGQIGAVAGMGFVIGPALGGLIYKITGVYAAPLYFAAAVTLMNTVWGYFAMPESLPPDKRVKIEVSRLNPFVQLKGAFMLPQLRVLFISVFLWTATFSMLQSNLSYLTEDRFGWQPDSTSLLFFEVGMINILVQLFLTGRLVKRFGEAKLTAFGMVLQGIGFLLVGIVGLTLFIPGIFVALACTALGNSLITPSLNGLISESVSAREQGRVQGGNQSVQALGRVIGPLYGGWAYQTFNQSVPYFTASVGVWAAAGLVTAAMPSLKVFKIKRQAEELAAANGELIPGYGAPQSLPD